MPRKSLAELTVVPVTTGRVGLKTLHKLRVAEQKVFDYVTRNHRHLVEIDVPLLECFCVAQARMVTKGPHKIAEFDKLARIVTNMATKLRLSPQSRIDPEKASRRYSGSKPAAVVRNKNPWVDNEESDDSEEETASEEN
jgi:hypothetical protein